jgi:hypothetical protein
MLTGEYPGLIGEKAGLRPLSASSLLSSIGAGTACSALSASRSSCTGVLEPGRGSGSASPVAGSAGSLDWTVLVTAASGVARPSMGPAVTTYQVIKILNNRKNVYKSLTCTLGIQAYSFAQIQF